ncbi:MAG: DUF58 domain-containing protein [Steroidobacterales bacterium]
MNRLRLAAAMRLRAWAARRHGRDSLPLRIHVRRIYILPTGYGLVLAALIIAMLLAGLNYNSNLGLAFGFLMASIAMVAMHHCHRNLLGLKVDADAEADGFAGGTAEIGFLLQDDSGADRYDIEIRCAPGAAAMAAVRAGAGHRASVALPTPARGVVSVRQFELRTSYPLGWFRAWTYVQSPLTVYVAPRPDGTRAPPAGAADGQLVMTRRRGDEDFAGLGPYTPGIPLKHMAWKTLARGGEAAVRNYLDLAGSPQWLDWNLLAGIPPEARLSQLCRWVLEMDAARRPYGLRLPELELAPAHGAAQREACLRALARFAAEPPR